MLFFNLPDINAQTFAGQGGLAFPPGAPGQTTGNTTSAAVVSGAGTLGNVLAVSPTPTFGLPTGGQLGVTYYISAVAGNSDGSGSFDPADGCLSVSAGVPVVFYEVAAGIGPSGSICAGDCYQVDLSLDGVSPFEVSYQAITPNGNSTETLRLFN